MLNRDLIKNLKEYNLDADVTLVDSEDIAISYICKDIDGGDVSPSDTPLLFIEGVDKYVECTSEYMHEEEDVVWCAFFDRACQDKEHCDYFEEYDNG